MWALILPNFLFMDWDVFTSTLPVNLKNQLEKRAFATTRKLECFSLALSEFNM